MPSPHRHRVIRFVLASLLIAAPAWVPGAAADEIGDALDTSQQAQRAARESQARIDKLDNETRALRQKRRDAQWRAMQQSAYARQLEKEAAAEEGKRANLEAQVARIAATEKDLMPLMQKMVADLEQFVAADLPFLVETRRDRVSGLKTLLEDPARSASDKYRRVLDAFRTEVDYGHSVGVEETTLDVAGKPQPVSLVRIGRVGLYYLTADGASGGAWDPAAKRWTELDSDYFEDVRLAASMAQSKTPPELVVLPVAQGRESGVGSRESGTP